MTDELLRDEPFHPEVLTSDVVFEGKVWNLRSDRVRYGGGEMVREYVDHTGAVAVIALDDEDRMLLIQQYRHPIRERDWEVPAGLLDVPGEEPLLAAQRELAEEADLEASEWEPLIGIHPSPGGNNELIQLFLARGLRATDTAFEREHEEADMRLEWVALDDVVSAVLDGRMRNSVLVTGALAIAAKRSRGA